MSTDERLARPRMTGTVIRTFEGLRGLEWGACLVRTSVSLVLG